MTKNELNRDVNRLRKAVLKIKDCATAKQQKEIETEFHRLYDADREFEYLNKRSVLILLRINLRFRFVQLHNFGIRINLGDL